MVAIKIIRTKNPVALAIHAAMWLWAILRGLPTTKCYNHAEVHVFDMVSGAIGGGVETRLWKEYKAEFEGCYFRFINYPLRLTDDQLQNGIKYLKKVEGRKYEFENFLWHIIKIITGKWKGDRNAKQLYCYEHVIRFLNATGKYNISPYLNPYEFKVWADKNLV
ncbi:MAG: hypothetical protein ACLFUH_06580 [Bacteroidales bacterium]